MDSCLRAPGLFPSHFHSCPLGCSDSSGPEQRTPYTPTHKCTEQAIKLTLWQLFSHPFDGPVSAHLSRPERDKKVKLGCVKNDNSQGLGGWGSRAGARLMSHYGV